MELFTSDACNKDWDIYPSFVITSHFFTSLLTPSLLTSHLWLRLTLAQCSLWVSLLRQSRPVAAGQGYFYPELAANTDTDCSQAVSQYQRKNDEHRAKREANSQNCRMLYLTFAADVLISIYCLSPSSLGQLVHFKSKSAERWAVGSQPGQETLIGKTWAARPVLGEAVTENIISKLNVPFLILDSPPVFTCTLL